MQLHSNTGGSSLEALIVACSDSVKAMAWGFARRSLRIPVEADEMYSVGMLAVCEAAARGVEADNSIAYLCKAAKYAMIDEYRRLHGWSTTSLDTPLSESTEVTWLDVLPAPVLAVPAVSRPSRALRGAMRRLVSSRQRAVLRRRYGLPGYGASTLRETARSLHTSVPAVDSAGRRGLRNLAADSRLRRVVGLEVAQ